MAFHNNIGKLGEDTACKFLMKHGFKILEKNYLRKWGEIDIVAERGGKIHFIEVKSVSRENIRNVSGETLENDRPEENIHPRKVRRLGRAIQTYLSTQKKGTEWQFDVVAIFLDVKNKEARVRFMRNLPIPV